MVVGPPPRPSALVKPYSHPWLRGREGVAQAVVSGMAALGQDAIRAGGSQWAQSLRAVLSAWEAVGLSLAF